MEFIEEKEKRNKKQRIFTFVFTDAFSEKDPGACRSSKRPNRDAVGRRRKIDYKKEKETDSPRCLLARSFPSTRISPKETARIH